MWFNYGKTTREKERISNRISSCQLPVLLWPYNTPSSKITESQIFVRFVRLQQTKQNEITWIHDLKLKNTKREKGDNRIRYDQQFACIIVKLENNGKHYNRVLAVACSSVRHHGMECWIISVQCNGESIAYKWQYIWWMNLFQAT